MDVDSIAPGTDFGQTIESTLEQTDIFLVIVGPRWTDITDSSGQPRLHEPRDFVRREVEAPWPRRVSSSYQCSSAAPTCRRERTSRRAWSDWPTAKPSSCGTTGGP